MRLPRVYVEGAIYYITCRGAHNDSLFRDEKDYRIYIELLEKYRKEYNFKLFAYVLLPQHLHLLIEPAQEAGISEIMRSLNTAYPKYFNSRYNRQGHLFRERFKACIVEKKSYLLEVISHIHLNPLRIDRKNSFEAYSYSSLYLYYKKEEASLRDEIKEALGYLGDKSYQQYLISIQQQEDLDLHKHLRKGILGSKEFVKGVREEIKSHEQGIGVQEDSSQQGLKKRHLGLLGAGVFILIGLVAMMVFLKPPEEIDEPKKEIAGKSIFIKDMKDLNNSEWQIKLISLDDKERYTDTLSFIKGKFTSSFLHQKGFLSTNYSVSQENGRIIWETFQSLEDRSASWRGEVQNNKMQGILSLGFKGKKAQDFSFISIKQRRR